MLFATSSVKELIEGKIVEIARDYSDWVATDYYFSKNPDLIDYFSYHPQIFKYEERCIINMRDQRAIIIKSSKLQKIRNGFRDIFYQSARLKRKRIHDEWRNYLFNSDGSRRSIEDLSPDELRQFRLLQQEENQLTEMINKSILKCVACGKGGRDMVYNKAYGAWYCTECYGLHRGHAKKLAEKKKEGAAKPQGHEEKAIDELYRTFL